MNSHADEMVEKHISIENCVGAAVMVLLLERHGMGYPWLILVIHTLSAVLLNSRDDNMHRNSEDIMHLLLL
jgi:hypothetical protein